MKRRFLTSSCLALIMLLSILTVVAQAETPQPDRAANPIAATLDHSPIVAAPAYTYTTVITVTSGRDLDTSMSTTCTTSALHAAPRHRAGAQCDSRAASGVDQVQHPHHRDPKLLINAGHLAHLFASPPPMPRCCGA